MKLFFKNLLIFVLPLIISVIIMDFYLANMNSLYKEKAEGLTKHAKNIEILILGNSHAARGVDPSSFSTYAFNIANVGQSIYFDKELTIQNLKKLEKLKYVLISLDYHTFYFSNQIGERDMWSYYGNGIKHPSKSYKKANISAFIFGYDPRVSFSLIKKDLLNKWKFRNHSHFLDFDTEIGVLKTDTIIKGFISFSGTKPTIFTQKHYTITINRYNKLINNSNKKEKVLGELDQLITTLQKQGVTPIFFSTPTFHDYNSLLDTKILHKNKSTAEILCKKYKIQFLDYARQHDFTKSEFYNPDHLNKKGAKRFAEILNSRLIILDLPKEFEKGPE